VVAVQMFNHPTRLKQRLDASGEVEIVTYDLPVQHKAIQAQSNQKIIHFVFWNGDADGIVEGIVTSCHSEEPFRFVVKRQLGKPAIQPKLAQTARLEREQGGQPQARSSGDTAVSAAGPHDKPALATDATKGSGMLPIAGNASDSDMAPNG
jgi:hypothetical protein